MNNLDILVHVEISDFFHFNILAILSAVRPVLPHSKQTIYLINLSE